MRLCFTKFEPENNDIQHIEDNNTVIINTQAYPPQAYIMIGGIAYLIELHKS